MHGADARGGLARDSCFPMSQVRGIRPAHNFRIRGAASFGTTEVMPCYKAHPRRLFLSKPVLLGGADHLRCGRPPAVGQTLAGGSHWLFYLPHLRWKKHKCGNRRGQKSRVKPPPIYLSFGRNDLGRAGGGQTCDGVRLTRYPVMTTLKDMKVGVKPAKAGDTDNVSA